MFIYFLIIETFRPLKSYIKIEYFIVFNFQHLQEIFLEYSFLIKILIDIYFIYVQISCTIRSTICVKLYLFVNNTLFFFL